LAIMDRLKSKNPAEGSVNVAGAAQTYNMTSPCLRPQLN
jgi:hypothetical protein